MKIVLLGEWKKKQWNSKRDFRVFDTILSKYLLFVGDNKGNRFLSRVKGSNL